MGKPEAQALRTTAQAGVDAGGSALLRRGPGMGGALREGAAGPGHEFQLAAWSTGESEPERRGRVDSGVDTELCDSDSWGIGVGREMGTSGSYGERFELEP